MLTKLATQFKVAKGAGRRGTAPAKVAGVKKIGTQTSLAPAVQAGRAKATKTREKKAIKQKAEGGMTVLVDHTCNT